MSDVVFVERNRSEMTGVFTTVSETTSARARYFVAVYGAFVAGYIYRLDYVRVVHIAAHSDFYSFGKYRSFLVYATTHRRNFARNDNLRYAYRVLGKRAFPHRTRDFAKYLIFQTLYLCVEFFDVRIHLRLYELLFYPCVFYEFFESNAGDNSPLSAPAFFNSSI